MNLTVFDQPYWWDVLFVLILVFCIRTAAKRGAFRAVSGILGTLLGMLVGSRFQDALAPLLEPLLEGPLRALAERTGASAFTGLPEGSALAELETVADKMSELYQSALDALAQALTQSLAPILAFLLLFLAVKLAIKLLCALLDLEIPLLSSLNRLAGGLLGALAGGLLVLVLCWAVLRFAPEEPVGLLSQPCLRESLLGGLIARLFFPAP